LQELLDALVASGMPEDLAVMLFVDSPDPAMEVNYMTGRVRLVMEHA